MITLKKPSQRLGERVRAFAGDERASVTFEFVLWFPFFFLIFLWTIDITVILMRATLFDRALDIVVRQVRLGVGPATYQDFKDDLCGIYSGDVDCNTNLTLELRPLAQGGEFPGDVECRDRASPIEPPLDYDPGAGNQLMLVRACMYIDPFINLAGFLFPGADGPSTYRFRGLSAFVNEPS